VTVSRCKKEKREPGRRGGNLTLSLRRKELLSIAIITYQSNGATNKNSKIIV